MATATSPPDRANEIRPVSRVWIRNTALLLLVLASIIGTGILQRRWSNAYSGPEDLAVAAERIRALPNQVGAWDGKELDKDSFNDLPQEVFGTMASRRYLNRASGTSLD